LEKKLIGPILEEEVAVVKGLGKNAKGEFKSTDRAGTKRYCRG